MIEKIFALVSSFGGISADSILNRNVSVFGSQTNPRVFTVLSSSKSIPFSFGSAKLSSLTPSSASSQLETHLRSGKPAPSVIVSSCSRICFASAGWYAPVITSSM
uniref:(northern house mosquito) hypothetical protein n=1 Tax=Culex pipiens TaxID=7175 RepID=A0A8D8A0I9_CULPI